MKFPKKKALVVGATALGATAVIAGAGLVLGAGMLVQRFRMAPMSGKVVLIIGGSEVWDLRLLVSSHLWQPRCNLRKGSGRTGGKRTILRCPVSGITRHPLAGTVLRAR